MQYSGEETAARRETRPMAEGPLRPVIRRIRRLAGDEDLATLGDGPLLARFAVGRDEAAFAELVQRHGPMLGRPAVVVQFGVLLPVIAGRRGQTVPLPDRPLASRVGPA